MSALELATAVRTGPLVIDTRLPAEFAKSHAAGSINLPYTKSFLTYSGSVLPYDRELYVIAGNGNADSIIDDLSLIGLDRIGGIYSMRSIDELASAGIAMESTSQLTTDALKDRLARNGQVVVDVRGNDEWEHGHIPGAIHIPLGSLESRLAEIPEDGDLAVHCEGGTRSAIAASILQRNGIAVANVVGGFREWERSGGDIVRGDGSLD